MDHDLEDGRIRDRGDSADELPHSHWISTRQTRLLTATEEVDLARRIRDGDMAARTRMVESNFRLVVSIARRYRCRGLAFEDLIQEGLVGLMAAVSRYDPDRGYRFSTYATHWIRQAIGRAIDNHGRLIRLPSHVSESLRKLEQCRQLLARRLGRVPTLSELEAETGVPSAKIEMLTRSSQDTLSLDTLLGESEETHLADLLLDPEAPDPVEATLITRHREAVESLLGLLQQRERSVIERRFGFADGRIHSLQEVGEQLQMSREGVRQIEVRALQKLKDGFIQSRLEEYAG